MSERFFALLIHDQPGPMESLKSALKDLSVDTYSVRNLQEARRLIAQTHPHMVFTDPSLPDGNWTDVIGLTEKAGSPSNVIVVGAIKDVKFYLAALERGAFDFVLPPFEHDSLDFVVNSAGADSRRRRQALSRLAAA